MTSEKIQVSNQTRLSIFRRIPGNIYAVVLLLFVFRFSSPEFLNLSNLLNIVQQGSILAIVSIGSFLAIVSHGIDLSLGAIVGLAGIVAALAMDAGWGIGPACFLALLVGAVFGAVNGFVIARTYINPFIVTLGMMGIGEGLALILGKGSTVSAGNPVFKLFGGGNLGLMPVAALIAIGCYFLFAFVLKRTALGTHIYAIGGNEEAAVLSGINAHRIKLVVYSFNGLLAGLAGIIMASRLGAANPSQGIGIEFDGIAAAVVGGASLAGGKGSVWGTLGGAVIIAILRNGLNMAGLPMALQMVILGMIIIAIVTIDSLRS
jgi:ribose/xylose/arabinose/galactoside ABC-type transport system permease subunit